LRNVEVRQDGNKGKHHAADGEHEFRLEPEPGHGNSE
jgi:hypothetical protein